MGVQAGKSNTDTTGESAGQSQYQNAGGQQASGSNSGYTNVQYLSPQDIAAQKGRYSGLLDKSQGDTGSTFGAASQFYGGLLNSPGYDTGTKNAISAIGNAAANEKLDEGKAAAERHAAATGNDAGYTAGLSNLYGQGARDTAERANQNQLAFYQEQQRQKELGGAGTERLFGTAQGAQLGLLGGMNNLSTLGSGTQSGGQYENSGSQYGNGSATNQNTMHQAGQSTHTGGEGDAANGLGNLLQGLFGGGSKGGSSGSGGGLGGALGSALSSLFGGNKGGDKYATGNGQPSGQGGGPGAGQYINGVWTPDPFNNGGNGMDNGHTGLIDGGGGGLPTFDPNDPSTWGEYDPYFGGNDPSGYTPYDPYADPGYDPGMYDPNYDPYNDPTFNPDDWGMGF